MLDYYYKAIKMTDAKTRYDIVLSYGEYEYFESLLLNRRRFNIGGLSFNLIDRPNNRWAGDKRDKALAKGSRNITTINRPDFESNIGVGDINGTNDACVVLYNKDFQEKGIESVEVFILSGCKNDVNAIWNRFSFEDVQLEVESIKERAVNRFIG